MATTVIRFKLIKLASLQKGTIKTSLVWPRWKNGRIVRLKHGTKLWTFLCHRKLCYIRINWMIFSIRQCSIIIYPDRMECRVDRTVCDDWIVLCSAQDYPRNQVLVLRMIGALLKYLFSSNLNSIKGKGRIFHQGEKSKDSAHLIDNQVKNMCSCQRLQSITGSKKGKVHLHFCRE